MCSSLRSLYRTQLANTCNAADRGVILKTGPQPLSKIEEIESSIELSHKLQEGMQGLFPSFIFGVKSYTERSANPNVRATEKESLHVLHGSLVVFLFSMWDSHMNKNCIEKYFRPEEKIRFYAFKHIRIVSAHNINGSRAGNRKDQDRMDHAEKLDQVMSSEKPFEGLILDEYNIDLSGSNVSLDCRQFMQDMALKLATGRIDVGAPHGKIKLAGGGTTEVM